jgi:anti-sigma factor RsiW
MKGKQMNDSEYRELIEASWQRRLSDEEQSILTGWLAAHPELQAAWDSEVALNNSLARLPDAPLSSNFTAQVMQALDREKAAAVRQHSFLERVERFVRTRAPRIGWAFLLVGLLLFGMQQHRKAARQELANGLAALASVAALPDPRALQDMDAVQQLSRLSSGEDEELFKVLNQ